MSELLSHHRSTHSHCHTSFLSPSFSELSEAKQTSSSGAHDRGSLHSARPSQPQATPLKCVSSGLEGRDETIYATQNWSCSESCVLVHVCTKAFTSRELKPMFCTAVRCKVLRRKQSWKLDFPPRQEEWDIKVKTTLISESSLVRHFHLLSPWTSLSATLNTNINANWQTGVTLYYSFITFCANITDCAPLLDSELPCWVEPDIKLERRAKASTIILVGKKRVYWLNPMQSWSLAAWVFLSLSVSVCSAGHMIIWYQEYCMRYVGGAFHMCSPPFFLIKSR